MKGYVSGVVGRDPTSRTAAILNKNWLNFLETNAPPEVKGQLSMLNKNYRQFAEARIQYSKIIGKAGEFNRGAANKYLTDYFKSNIDSGTQELVNLISKGNEIVTGIEGVETKFNALKELKPQRGKLLSEIPAMKQLKQEALNKLANDAVKKVSKVRAMRSKYDEFLSRYRVQQEKTVGGKLMRIPRAIKSLGRILRRGGTILSIAPMILDAVRYSQDPEAYMYQMETGQELAPKDSMEREIQTGRLI